MAKNVFLIALALPLVAHAAVTWYPGKWYLYKGTNLLGIYDTQSKCINAASKLDSGWYACNGSSTVMVTAR